MAKADPSERKIIFELREHPVQTRKFINRGKEIKIKFELEL
jgi:hypothetical protein